MSRSASGIIRRITNSFVWVLPVIVRCPSRNCLACDVDAGVERNRGGARGEAPFICAVLDPEVVPISANAAKTILTFIKYRDARVCRRLSKLRIGQSHVGQPTEHGTRRLGTLAGRALSNPR